METWREGRVGFKGGVDVVLVGPEFEFVVALALVLLLPLLAAAAAPAAAWAGSCFLEGEAAAMSSLGASLVENMRVRRSLTEAFSAVDCLGSCCSGTGPFWGLSLGEPALLEIATDFMEEGCEDEEAVADFATGIGGVLAMAIRRSEEGKGNRRGRGVGGKEGVTATAAAAAASSASNSASSRTAA